MHDLSMSQLLQKIYGFFPLRTYSLVNLIISFPFGEPFRNLGYQSSNFFHEITGVMQSKSREDIFSASQLVSQWWIYVCI